MLVRMTRKAVETLEFRGAVIVLALAGALIVYFSVYHGHRTPPDDQKPAPTVPKGDQAPVDRY